MERANRWLVAATVVVLLGAAAGPASAQYFGRNKVQYRTFRFEVLRTEHFDVYFYAEERAAAELAARLAERWFARLARVLSYELLGRQPLILYGSHGDFEQTNVIEGELGEGTGGVTESLKRRIVLPLGGSLAETDHVVGHELVHAFQYDITDMGGPHSGVPGAALGRLPLWFVEGMAEYLSLGPVDAHTAMWMRDAASQEKLPNLAELDHARYFPYRWGQALWAYLTGSFGESAVGSLLRASAASGNIDAAMRTVLGAETPDDLIQDWHKALRAQASDVRQITRRITDSAKLLYRGPNSLSLYNVAPALSPDGRRLMFLSQRNALSIDLYLADAETGRIVRKVVDGAVQPQFSSLGFINSAGAWSPDGRRFMLAVMRSGRPTLVILDVAAGATEREIPFTDLGEIFSPSWSPDGGAVAFSAQQGGWTDLFTHDLRSGTTRRLTHDAFADLQPAWSPDGRRLVFVSDRFTTSLSDMTAGAYQLVQIDLDRDELRGVSGADVGKNINPQWSRDGHIYFVTDRTGISNIYRVSGDGGPIEPMTNVATGVSGITALSPAISLASASNRLAFSFYENNQYSIYAIDGARLSGLEPQDAVAALGPAQLPPAKRERRAIVGLPPNPLPLPPLPAPTTESAPYKARLSLDLVGQPYLTAGVDPYGMFLGGGLALFFSDVLGDYSLGTAVQLNGDIGGNLSNIARNIGGQVAFVNRKHRWNYGVAGGQMPYTAAAFAAGVSESDGEKVGVAQTIIYRQVERSASGVATYAVNAARRFEFAGGLANVSFDQRVFTTTYDLSSGRAISDTHQSVPGAAALNLGQFGAAVVYDTSRFGATSPVAGESYRLQVTPTVGTLHFTSVLADYRRYVMPVPFYTIAGRVLHYGKYGRDSEDARIVPSYLGYPNLVRGYDVYSFDSNECTPLPSGVCQEFERLIGSRIAVANLEFRFPLLRPFGVKPEMYGPVPIEIALFADVGVAWNSRQKPSVLGGGRRGVSSGGVAVRVNILGVLVAEFDVTRPFQRPRAGWVFQLNVSPGF
jgi:Tol biopolymer transport system component